VSCLKLDRDAGTADVLERVAEVTGGGRPLVVDVAIDYSRKTYFTAGVIRTNLGRLPWRDRLRFLGRAAGRRILPGSGAAR
jgi:acetolactate synthase-1/2/3 large subunit